jgi:diguanylate cyclase (GGDEF)-like protein
MMLDVTLVRVSEAVEDERARTYHELDRRQEEVAYLATHDPLTGLPNRELLLDRCDGMLSRSRRRGTPAAVLAIGVDSLGAIGETFGPPIADELLRAVGERLDALVRETDALGRLGAEEFAVLAEDLPGSEGAELIADRLLASLAEPFHVQAPRDTELTLIVSIGVATGQNTTADELVRDAEIAMRRARVVGGARWVMFEEGMEDVVQTRMELEMELRGALANRELFLVYQPSFNLADLAPIGVETLLRWRRPGRGVVAPADFVPLLEETGLIVDVGSWVLREACSQCATWRREGHALGVAVNVSARQLDTDRFIEDVRAALDVSGLEGSALTLDITETTIMRDAEETAERLLEVKALGVRVAIDDFGTGYSSLSQLQRFPVDALKIDRSFISQLGDSPEAETLVRTLVQLGRALSIETLAEGIEQESELALLRRERCQSGQGFLFARPLEPAAATEFLERWRPHSTSTLPQPAGG